MFKMTCCGAIVAGALSTVALPALAQTAATALPAIVRVVHGIPGNDVSPSLDPQLPVDVLANGKLCLLKGITFGTVSGPLSIPAGTYTIGISLANSVSPCSNTPVIKATVAVKSGEEAAIVAALSTSGAPTAYAFPLDFGSIKTGFGRVTVAHAADAPPVTVSFNDKRPIADLQPGKEGTADLATGGYSVEVFPAGSNSAVIGPLVFNVPPRSVSLVFAVGSATTGSITLIVDAINEVF
jgi:hypothetical protein